MIEFQFRCENETEVYRDGLCMGMSVCWLRQSLKYGAPLTQEEFDQFLEQRDWVMTKYDYTFDDDSEGLDAFHTDRKFLEGEDGITVGRSHRCGYHLLRPQLPITKFKRLAQLITQTSGAYLIRNHNHAMGALVVARGKDIPLGTVMFFDPNEGQSKPMTVGEFVGSFPTYMRKEYGVAFESCAFHSLTA